MPQLYSRMDDTKWLTPSIADILDQGSNPPGGDGTLREQILALQGELADQGTPARIVNVRPTTSHTLFIVQPDAINRGTTGRLGSRKIVGPNDLKRSVGKIAETHREWRVGFMPKVEDSPDTVGLLLRTADHSPFSLRRLLIRAAYRDHPSTLALALGQTLDQRMVIRDLATSGHLLLIGADEYRNRLVSGIALTLTLFNTPAELRLLLAGSGTEQYATLSDLPHTLGKRVTGPDALIRLTEGLTQEIQQRMDSFAERQVSDYAAYRSAPSESGQAALARIIIILDSLSDFSEEQLNRLQPHLRDILLNGPRAGLHLLLCASEVSQIPGSLSGLIPHWIVDRNIDAELGGRVEHFHNSLLRFIDAFVVDVEDDQVTPVEVFAISEDERQRAVDYWRQVARARQQDKQDTPTLSAPVPSANAPATAARQQPDPDRLVAQRARMLAAYLGWLSVGPLRDVLGLSDNEAFALITMLQADGILEEGDHGVYRFVRLAEPPV